MAISARASSDAMPSNAPDMPPLGLPLTTIFRFERSNDLLTIVVSSRFIFKFESMSSRTLGTAVAVRASTGTDRRAGCPRNAGPMRRNAGRKSCPHSETQWLSSTAKRHILPPPPRECMFASPSRNVPSPPVSFSGVT